MSVCMGPQPAEDSDVMTQEEGVDTFTMLHESLHAYSNSGQLTWTLLHRLTSRSLAQEQSTMFLTYSCIIYV